MEDYSRCGLGDAGGGGDDYNRVVEPETIESVAGRHGIELLLQFGSSVSGREHPLSDVDLGVLFATPGDPLRDLGAVIRDLQPFFPTREVDLAVLNHTDPLFLKKVTEGCRLLFGSPARLQHLKLYAFKRYQDHRRFLELEKEYVRRQAAARR